MLRELVGPGDRQRQTRFVWLGVLLVRATGHRSPRRRAAESRRERPFLVDRQNERLVQRGTGVPISQQIADYERRLRREAHARNAAAKHARQQGSTGTDATS